MPAPRWTEVDWRSRQRWVTVGGGPVNVIELGEGPPVVFIHGLGGSWQNWLCQLPVIAERHRVVAFDLPGFGASPMPRGPITIAGYVNTTLELLDALSFAQVAVVGNSMGGLIAAELALAAPDRVSRLALISPAGVPLSKVRDRMGGLRRVAPLVGLAMGWVGAHAEDLARRPRLRSGLIATVAHRPDRMPAAFVAEQLRGMGTPAFWPALESLAPHSVCERLAEIACPTLLIWGRHDHVLPVRHSDVFAGAIPGVRTVIYPDTAHCSMFERADDVNLLLAELFGDAPAAGTDGAEQPAASPAAGQERPLSV